jgi:hypothetical protein
MNPRGYFHAFLSGEPSMLSLHRIAWPLLIVLAFSAGAAWRVTTAQDTKAKAVQKWEYEVVYVTSVDKTVKQLGDDGWELVAAVWMSGPNQTACYLKRPK